MKQRILIVGQGSFLAENIKAHFLRNDYCVNCVRNDFFLDNFDNLSSLDTSLEESDIIIASGIDSISEGWKRPAETLKSQFFVGLKILWYLKAKGFKNRIIFIGSGEEYGSVENVSLGIDEKTPLNPLNIYGASKSCQTLFAQLFEKTFGLDILIIRCFNEIGEGQDERFFVSYLCKKAAEAKHKGKTAASVSVGNLLIQRCFIDVRDISRAIQLLIENGKSGEIYNVGSENSIELGTLVKLISEVSKVEIHCKADPTKFRLLDPPNLIPSIKKIRDETGWEPIFSLENTLKHIFNYWIRYLENEEKITLD